MAKSASRSRLGCSPLFIGLAFIALMFLALGADMAYIGLLDECAGDITMECIESIGQDVDLGEEETITAKGTKSGVYAGEERSVTVSLTFPGNGGAVTGTFTGSCDGEIKGTYAGKGGLLSGTGGGSCAFIFPASGTIAGPVNTASKTIPLAISGSAGGFSGQTSMMLSW